MSGSPNVRGLTIDTASDTQPIIDEWGTNDVSSKSNYILLCKRARFIKIEHKYSNNHDDNITGFILQSLENPHDIAVSLTGDAIYVAEITPGKGPKLQKYDVMAEDNVEDSL